MRMRFRAGWIFPMLICIYALTNASSGNQSAAQSKQAGIETLFGTPPLASIPSDTSVELRRITYGPGEAVELNFPGPTVLFVEKGELAVPQPESGEPIVLLYSGPETSPPPTGTDNGDDVLPAGYAVLIESGQLGTTRNTGSESAVALAVLLIPERTEEGRSLVAEATAAP